MADWVDVMRIVHLLAFALWLGGALFALAMVMPSVNAAGMAGKQFMMTVVRRGGFGKYFGPVASVAVLSGLILFWARGYHDGPFETASTAMLTVGAILGLSAFGEGLAVNLPAERKLKAIVTQVGPQGPTPAQGQQIEALAQKLGKASLRGSVMLLSAFLLMVGRVLLL